MSDDPVPGTESYWEDVEDVDRTRTDGSGRTIREAIEDAAGDEWSVHGMAVVGEDGRDRYVLVVRSRVGDEGLLLRLGYFVLDLDDPVDGGGWGEQMDMRVSGDLPTALTRMLARTSNDRLAADDLDDPLALSILTDDGGVEQDPAILDRPVDEDDRDDRREDLADRRHESVEQDATPSTVECVECGDEDPPTDMVNLGSGIGIDVWVHPRCNGDEGGEDDGGE